MPESRWDQLSRIGGAAQGGSAKPPGEREVVDRGKGTPRTEKPAGQAMRARGIVGSFSNDKSKDQDSTARDKGTR